MTGLDRPLSKDVLRIGIREELETIRDAAPAGNDHTARTLVKDHLLRVTLVTLFPGGQIAPHRSPGPITIQPVEGTIELEAAGEAHELAVGDMLALQAGVEHAVESTAGGSFLLTIALPARSEGSGGRTGQDG